MKITSIKIIGVEANKAIFNDFPKLSSFFIKRANMNRIIAAAIIVIIYLINSITYSVISNVGIRRIVITVNRLLSSPVF